MELIIMIYTGICYDYWITLNVILLILFIFCCMCMCVCVCVRVYLFNCIIIKRKIKNFEKN